VNYRRLIGAVLAGGAPAATPAVAIASGPVAEQPNLCHPPGSPNSAVLYWGNSEVVREAVNDGNTCNYDTFYSGKVQDPITDGSCAYVKVSEDKAHVATQGYSCTTGAWSGYTYDGPDTLSYLQLATDYTYGSWLDNRGY
jgi:hypothetical protein